MQIFANFVHNKETNRINSTLYISIFCVKTLKEKFKEYIYFFLLFFVKKKLFSKNKGKTEQKMRGFNLDRQSMFLKQTTFEPNA